MTLSIRAIAMAGIASILACSAVARADSQLPAYEIVKTVPLGAPDKWDFLYFDASANLVYISHRTKVDVVDPVAGKIAGELPGLGESHGVVTVPELGRAYADDAGSQSLVVFDSKTFAKIATAQAGVDADAVVFDSASRDVFVMDADGQSVTAVDTGTSKTVKTVPLGGSPEFAAADGKGTLFINIASTNEIAVFDTKTLSIRARWATGGCEKPHGMAMDQETNRLFVSCADARMLVIDTASGSVLADLPIGKGTDAAAFDPVRKLAFSSNKDGTLSVIAERGANDFVSLGDIKTPPGARTMALDPQSGRIFLVTGDVANPASGDARISFVPGSLKLLVLAPAQ